MARAERGLIDAELGGGVIKQRVARAGAGRSGGYRTLIIYRSGHRAIFAFGFAKNQQANIDAADERDLKAAARIALGLADDEVDRLVQMGELEEVEDHGEDKNLSQ